MAVLLVTVFSQIIFPKNFKVFNNKKLLIMLLKLLYYVKGNNLFLNEVGGCPIFLKRGNRK
jgi:hypothetical protein